MKRYGMVIFKDMCVGCHSCRTACQNQNGLSYTESFNRLDEVETGGFPYYRRGFVPMQCQHCDNPPCVKVCPTGASFKAAEGIVSVDYNRCIGCKYCILACPYNARIIDNKFGYVKKCAFCIEHVKRGETPACQSTCPMGVRVFGDLNDPLSEVSRLIRDKKAQRLRGDLGTAPSIYYVTG